MDTTMDEESVRLRLLSLLDRIPMEDRASIWQAGFRSRCSLLDFLRLVDKLRQRGEILQSGERLSITPLGRSLLYAATPDIAPPLQPRTPDHAPIPQSPTPAASPSRLKLAFALFLMLSVGATISVLVEKHVKYAHSTHPTVIHKVAVHKTQDSIYRHEHHKYH